MTKGKMIRSCLFFGVFFSVIAIANVKKNYFIIPSQESMLNTQSNLFTICSVFAGFSFSILGLIMGIFSEKIIQKLKGTTLIHRKCVCIVKSIVYFCVSGFVSLVFMVGFNVYLSEVTDMGIIVNNVLYINGIGFLLVGMIYFIAAVKNLFIIIEKIYGLNDKEWENKRKKFAETKKNLEEKRTKL